MAPLGPLAAAFALLGTSGALRRKSHKRDPETEIFARGLEYINEPGLDTEGKNYLLGTASLEKAAWAQTYVDVMEELPTGVEVDDHMGTPIGNGESIGLVAASLSLDPAQVRKLPPEFQTGIFQCGRNCPSMLAAIRASHTSVDGMELMRFSLKIDSPSHGEVDFHFTETLPGFPMKDKDQLEAFTYMVERGTFLALLRHPIRMASLASQQSSMKSKYGDELQRAGSLGKTYYSMVPFRIGLAGPTAGAFKVRLVAEQQQSYPGGSDQQSYLQNMRDQFAADVQAKVHTFSFEIQVATSAADHKINDAYTEWNETSSPWIRMGSVEIPRQSFTAPVTVGNVVGSGLWVNGKARFNSKELAFLPGNAAHPPIGDIGSFRSYLYPIYDKARQAHLLQKPGGTPAQCPFSQMR